MRERRRARLEGFLGQHPRRGSGSEAGRLLEGGGELRMPLGQRIAHIAPKGGRRIRDLRGELLDGTGDAVPKVEARDVRAPASLPGLVGHVLHSRSTLVTGTGEYFVHALTRNAERTGKLGLVGAGLVGDKKGATQSCRSAR